MFNRVLEQTSVDPDHPERLTIEIELKVAALRGVHDAPALRRARARNQAALFAAVHEHVVAFPTERHPRRGSGIRRLERPVIADFDVAQHQHELIGRPDVIRRILHEQRAVQAEPDLRRRHDVRVIPEQAGVRHDEVVREGLTGLHVWLRMPWHAVHPIRHADAVPVHGGRLRQVVRKMHDQAITHRHAYQGTGDAAVVRPRVERLAWQDRDRRDARFQVDLNDSRVGVQVRRLRQFQPRVPVLGLNALLRSGSAGRRDDRQSEDDESELLLWLSVRRCGHDESRSASGRRNGATRAKGKKNAAGRACQG